MRLCWIHPTTRTAAMEPLWSAMESSVVRALRPGTEIEFRFLASSGNFTRSLYAEHLNSVHMVEAAIGAEAEGFDGVFLGCWNDALWEAREVLSIPVASVSEQSMLSALTMGRRFAVVTVSAKTATAIEMDILAYGLGERSIQRPARSIDPESSTELLLGAVTDPRREFLPRFEASARTCIADGAEVILVGCGFYGPLLREAGYYEIPGTGVPVLDASAVGVKHLEMMVDTAKLFRAAKSEGNTFRTPARPSLNACRASLGLYPIPT